MARVLEIGTVETKKKQGASKPEKTAATVMPISLNDMPEGNQFQIPTLPSRVDPRTQCKNR